MRRAEGEETQHDGDGDRTLWRHPAAQPPLQPHESTADERDGGAQEPQLLVVEVPFGLGDHVLDHTGEERNPEDEGEVPVGEEVACQAGSFQPVADLEALLAEA